MGSAVVTAARRHGPRPKFLLVDDVPENLLALEAVLRRDDVDLLMAGSGLEALELLLVHDFALAVLDVSMPEMDGFELAELMRTSERTRRVPIIFVTAAGRDMERRFRGYEAGAVDFFFKPIDARILRHKVEVFVELYKQRSELAETLRLNEELVAIVTHDLRSPLASILMITDALTSNTADPQVVKQADRIRRTGRQLITTVNELLDLSRARLAGGIPIERGDVDLGAIATRVVGDLAAGDPNRKLEIVVQGPDLRGYWDGARLEQALTNLLANAFIHGVPTSPVQVRVADEGADVVLTVENEGAIPEEFLPRIFNPFEQGYARRRSSGLGLGLYIVEQIVLAHGGTVVVRSVGRTTFTVRLPRRAA